jgi:hypothetical protein
MVFETCWNHHFMPRPCGLEFGLKNESAKLDIKLPHGEFQKYSSNESAPSCNSSHMSFRECVSCQIGGNELACEIPFLPSLEKNQFH